MQLLPISQVPSEPDTRPHRPMIKVVADEEFLILSSTGVGTMGVPVFININGDPVRGTLQRSSHPLSVCSSSLSLSPHVFVADHVTVLEYPCVTAHSSS
ncbi:hypothetical protein F5888DRAFT_1693125 [Russula emetica]|nr:hypothetical protein F5888DRAFT_1693125 [Russula emetica]